MWDWIIGMEYEHTLHTILLGGLKAGEYAAMHMRYDK